eukprot:Rmarinus@m.24154
MYFQVAYPGRGKSSSNGSESSFHIDDSQSLRQRATRMLRRRSKSSSNILPDVLRLLSTEDLDMIPITCRSIAELSQIPENRDTLLSEGVGGWLLPIALRGPPAFGPSSGGVSSSAAASSNVLGSPARRLYDAFGSGSQSPIGSPMRSRSLSLGAVKGVDGLHSSASSGLSVGVGSMAGSPRIAPG